MHETDFDHSHEELYARSADLEGLERLLLISVGVDIGSATTHLLFSRLTLRREGAGFSTRFAISEREILWSSPVLLTPYLSQTRIDFEKIRAFVETCYAQAGLSPQNIDSGAVVITGEALKKENARPIVDYFAGQAGKFICASAGPHHEALLAAHGSGAVQMSKGRHASVLNIDIGGGTTKLALIRDGKVFQTAALSIGARLIAFDAAGIVTRLEDAGAVIAQDAGFPLSLGAPLPQGAADAIAARLAQTLVSMLRGEANRLAEKLWITAPLDISLAGVDHIVFSGGVADCMQDGGAGFGDLGLALGQALQHFAATLPPGKRLEPAAGLRATVIGASAYTLQVSGTTSFAGAAILPLHGLKVIPAAFAPGAPFAPALGGAFAKFDLDGFGPGLALSIAIGGPVDYAVLREIAAAVGNAARGDPQSAVVVIVEHDVAQSLGQILAGEMRLLNPLLVIDGIVAGELDYIDIGEALGAAGVYPVTVKSLLFPAAP